MSDIADRIVTPRLVLRRGVSGDAPDLVAGLNDWAVAQWLINPPYPYSLADADGFLQIYDTKLPRLRGPYLVTKKGDDRVIGCVGIRPGPSPAELSYWLVQSEHGRGFMAEAAEHYVAAAVRADPSLSLFATTDPDNAASQAVLRRCGFSLTRRETRTTPTRRGALEKLVYDRAPDTDIE